MRRLSVKKNSVHLPNPSSPEISTSRSIQERIAGVDEDVFSNVMVTEAMMRAHCSPSKLGALISNKRSVYSLWRIFPASFYALYFVLN